MNSDELLTAFRSDIQLPDEAATRSAYQRATHSRRRLVTRRRLAVAVVLVAAGTAGALGATLGGASSNVNPERQRIVDNAMIEVRQAFGDHRIVKAKLDGSLLTVDITMDGKTDGVISPFEAEILGWVADHELRAAGDEGIESFATRNPQGRISPGVGGGGGLGSLPEENRLGDGACSIPAGAKLANVAAASGRIMPLLDGFCAIHLTTADAKRFAGGVEETLNQLWKAVPAAKPQDRPVLIQADDAHGTPVIAIVWDFPQGYSNAVYVRPPLCTPLVDAPIGNACSGGFDPGGAFYPTIDWAHPGGRDGRSVSTIREAAKRLPFQPVVPTRLGRPQAMAVDPETGSRSQLDVAFGRDASGGVHWLVERLSRDTTTKTLVEYARECRTIRGCKGRWEMVRLDDGNHGLLIAGPAGTTTTVDWVEHGIYFSVIGPSTSFSSRDARSIANTVIAGAATRG